MWRGLGPRFGGALGEQIPQEHDDHGDRHADQRGEHSVSLGHCSCPGSEGLRRSARPRRSRRLSSPAAGTSSRPGTRSSPTSSRPSGWQSRERQPGCVPSPSRVPTEAVVDLRLEGRPEVTRAQRIDHFDEITLARLAFFAATARYGCGGRPAGCSLRSIALTAADFREAGFDRVQTRADLVELGG